MSDAVLGGIVGAAVAFGLTQFSAASIAWREVTLHDDEAVERNWRLVAWVDAETVRLARAMQRIGDDFNGRGTFTSSANGAALAQAKAEALQRYRDEEEQVKLALARLKAAEGPWHVFWRSTRGHRKGLDLTAGEAVQSVLNRWREPVTRHGTGETKVFDITNRTQVEADLQSLNLS